MLPPYDVRATLANAPNNVQVVAALAKRTYEIVPGDRVRVAKAQVPLNAESAVDRREDRMASVPLTEPDLWPLKLATDVVVLGKVHAPRGQPTTQIRASVTVGDRTKAIQVFGDRRIELAGGQSRFSAPERFTEMDLSYFRAYGGIDPSAEMPNIGHDDIRDIDQLEQLLSDLLTPEKVLGPAYPRNPAGVGYIVRPEPEFVAGMLLPNFEDPSNLLTGEHFRPREPADWWRMPMPQGFGWFGSEWYPRCTYFGELPPYLPPDDTDAVEEVRMGLIPPGWSKHVAGLEAEQGLDWRMANGGSPGLILPLQGHEPVTLEGLAPDGDISFQLPGERPSIRISYRHQALDVRVSLHTVLIEPEHGRLSLVWGAVARTPMELPERLPSPDDREFDPLEGIDIHVDGAVWTHEPEKLR